MGIISPTVSDFGAVPHYSLGTDAWGNFAIGSALAFIEPGENTLENPKATADIVLGGPSNGAGGAGKNITTASSCIFIGGRAGENVTTGRENIFIGENTGLLITTTTNNIAIGTSAMRHNTGEQNTVIGSDCLFPNVSTASQTTALGFWAVKNLETGKFNTAVGYEALEELKEGSENTAIGIQALFKNKTGSNKNTALGSEAGFENEGSENVFIGNQAGRKEKGSGKLYISNSNTATPLVLGDFTAKTLTLTAAVSLTSLGANAPAASVEHSSATYEIEPSASRMTFVAVRAVSKGATTAQYKIYIGGVEWTEILDPSITTSIDITVTCPVPAGQKLKVEKVAGELEKSFTTIL